MSLVYRSIINIVGFLLLCNNIITLSLDSSYADYYHDKEPSENVPRFSTLEEICTTDECTEPPRDPKKRSEESSGPKDSETTTMAARGIIHVDFEVFGKVQGVFFRKNTVDQGRKLKLKGWCMNTPNGTVKGAMEGDPQNVAEMKHWLSNVGSKMSRIDKAEFTNEKSVANFTFPDFSVRH